MPLPVRPDALAQALRALPALGFAGVNLTVPHKEAALALVDSAETTATAVERVLHDNRLLNSGTGLPPRFLATDAPGRFAHLGEIFLGEPIDPGAVTLVDL